MQDYIGTDMPKGMPVKFKRLIPDAVLPSYAKPGDAGLDLVATDDGNNVLEEDKRDGGSYFFREYGTGLAVEIPEGYVGLIFPRSSISKTSLALANAVGVIDSGYRGEIKFRFRIDLMPAQAGKPSAAIYRKGDKIGQLLIVPYPQVEVVEEVGDLSDSARGTGGFGSTGA